jgi:hypothetical protein
MSNKTKRNFNLFFRQTSSMERINSFLVTRLALFRLCVLRSQYSNGFRINSNATGMELSHVVHAVEQIEALHCFAFPMIIMPAHHFVFVGIRLFLHRIVKNQDRILPFYFADRRFDFLPQVLGRVLLFGEKTGYLIVADLPVHKFGQTCSGCITKRAQQVIRV